MANWNDVPAGSTATRDWTQGGYNAGSMFLPDSLTKSVSEAPGSYQGSGVSGGGATSGGGLWGWGGGAAAAANGAYAPVLQSGSSSGGSNSGSSGQPSGPGIVNYKPGPITSIVNDLLTHAIGGTNTPGASQTLNLMSQGRIPPALLQQYKQNLARSEADITERMGVMGNRFGTDLGRTLQEAAGQANVNLASGAMDRALQAIEQILGLGRSQESIEFAGNQASLDRAHQDFLAQQQQSSLGSLLEQLLGAGGTGAG